MIQHGENDIIPTVMGLLRKYGSLRTKFLVREVPKLLPLTPEDRAPLKNRSDTKITQVIRNLVSHRTLVKRGLATYDKGVTSIVAGRRR